MTKKYRGDTSRWRIACARAGFFLPGILALSLLIGFSVSGEAQSLNPADILQQLQQRTSGGEQINDTTNQNGGANLQTQQPTNQVYYPAGPLPTSRLEQILSARAGTKLKQFGYDQLGRGHAATIPQSGAVQDDYILGFGDQIAVVLRGQENSQLRASVDRNGQFIIARLNPIAAAGRTFGDFRRDVEAAVHRAYVATDAFVSIDRIRQINVLVSGEVNNPGQYSVTGLSSALDALLLSGGIKKTGSLRAIRVVRGGHSYTVDLYAMLTGGGNASAMRLTDGDRIIVPPLGPTVAVSGLVRLPGIFELPPGQAGISLRSALALAGGQEVRGKYRMTVLRLDADGRSSMVSLTGETGTLRDGEILFVQLGADQTANQAILAGGTGLSGSYPITPGTTLSDLMRQPGALGQSPYTLFGIIVRKDARSLLRNPMPFTPVAVLNGTEDMQLQTDDVVRPLTVSEASLLGSVVRAYLEKLADDQAVLRNPLIDQGATSVTPKLPAAVVSANSAAGAPAPGALGALPVSVSTLPLSKADELSFALNDLTSVPADVQRADIIALMDLRAPGTIGAGSQEALMEQQDQGSRLDQDSSNGAVPGSYGNVVPGGGAAYQNPGSNPAYQPNIPSTARQNRGDGDNAQSISQNYQQPPIVQDRFAGNREIKTFGELVRQLNIDPLILINFLIENRARLDGAVRGPGSYFVGPNVELSDLVQAAGGTVSWADDNGVELITTAIDHQTGHAVTQRQKLALRQNALAKYIVHPNDSLHFDQVFTDVGIGSVTIQGEIRSAGSYPIIRGEHLSDLLVRAGGLTNTAYPYGTVFLRKSAAAAEHDGYVRAATEIENSLVNAMTRIGNDKIDPSAFASLQTFVTELRNQKAVGRIAITADPSVLAAKPELDPLLEAGDLVYIPQRSSTVAVLGQVSQPGSFPYRAGRSVEDYIEMAGGYAALSDDSMTFVVLPDGSAHKIEKSWLHFDADALPPGSTIVVPRDVTPLDTRQLILDISSIFSQFAVSIASMAVLAKQ